MKFRPKNENELARLTDDALIAYAVSARDAERYDAFEKAIWFFIIKREPMVVAMVAGKVPSDSVDDVVQEVLIGALQSMSSFEGVATGQIVNWLKSIVTFKVADFHRANARHRKTDSIDAGNDSETEWFAEIIDRAGDQTGATEVFIVFQEVLGKLRAVHREVVLLRIDNYPSKEVAEIINQGYQSGAIESDGSSTMTPANVDKIYSRFKSDMSGALGLKGLK